MDLKQLMEEFKATTDQLHVLVKQQEEEIKSLGGSKAETAKQIDELDKRIQAMHAEMVELQKAAQRPGYGSVEAPKSVGEQFVESEAYKSMIERNAKGSDPVAYQSLFQQKQVTTGTAGDLVVPQMYLPPIGVPADRALRIRDLLPVTTTTSNSIEFILETFTNNAAGVTEGELKPYSDLQYEMDHVPVSTIAHWIPATRQILADAGQLRGYIDNRLIYGLKLEEENQILYGAGAPDLQGLLDPATGVQNAGAPAAGDTAIDHIRRAITLARLAEYPVTGIVLHPTNWEEIELLKDNEGRYIWVSVTEGGQPRLWRVPVVDTTAINEGEFLLGAWQMGAMLWDREQANIRVSEHHEDYFARNMVAILAEERLALTVFRPQAFVTGTFA